MRTAALSKTPLRLGDQASSRMLAEGLAMRTPNECAGVVPIRHELRRAICRAHPRTHDLTHTPRLPM
ncbi:unnamed protein product [Haemonchus placei]|uniref:Uncharacterized protein n=1 Tax=Haemonchus placei TaxID=6290 RepID=A0A3P8BY11_HAEPC|nr:unnamed protein product [Haemonchus placei]